MRGYLKIVKGKARGCMTLGQCGPKWTNALTSKSKDGWHQINIVIAGSHITDLDYVYGPQIQVFGEGKDDIGAFEMYLALPYMAIVMEKTADVNETALHTRFGGRT